MPDIENKGKYLMYKGKPLVRENNIICYGDMDDDYILFMMILSNKTIETPNGKKEEIPDMVLTQVLGREPGKPGHSKIVKQWTKNGLCDALDIGTVTLYRLNAKGELTKTALNSFEISAVFIPFYQYIVTYALYYKNL